MTRVDKFGCFVKLSGRFEKGVEDKGLVHVSEMHDKYVSQSSDVVSEKQKVCVKVIMINNGRLHLSMKGINQETGEALHDFDSQIIIKKNENIRNIGELTGIKI